VTITIDLRYINRQVQRFQLKIFFTVQLKKKKSATS